MGIPTTFNLSVGRQTNDLFGADIEKVKKKIGDYNYLTLSIVVV